MTHCRNDRRRILPTLKHLARLLRPAGRGMVLGALLVSLALPWPMMSAAVAAEGDNRVSVAELTGEVEVAIDKALKNLSTVQNKDGSWGSQYKCATTAVALMAFMLKGNFPKKGVYGQNMERGIDFLLKKSSEGSGYMGINMYEHGLSTLALSEAWGQSDRDEIRDALKRGVEVIIRAQANSGGWRYDPRPVDADISVTAMQVVALSSAREAGILVPAKVIERAQAYVKSCQAPGSGGFGYTNSLSPTFARSAAGTMALLMCGQRGSKAANAGLGYLKNLPESKFTRAQFFFYGHYYAMQSMYQGGDEFYQDWYPQIRDVLLTRQAKDGSWYGDVSDNGFGTAIAVLILGVPYRYLPIYQR